MISKHFFHIIVFLIFISFPFSSIALHVVTPLKGFKIYHSTTPSTSNFNTIDLEGNTKVTNFTGCFDKVYAFGDSYTDTGNAQILNGSKNFVKDQKSSNSTFGQRSNKAWLLIDFFVDALNMSLLPPYKSVSANFSSGVNFATAGATVFTSEYLGHHKINNNSLIWQDSPQSFQTQIEWYNKFVSDIGCKGKTKEGCKADMGNGLFWLGQMGVNDYVRAFGSNVSLKWLNDMTIAHTSKLLTTLLDSGAKYIMVQGLPPLGCYPFAKLSPKFVKDDMDCAADINRAVKSHNHELEKMLEGFRRKQGVNSTISYADYFNAYKVIMENLRKLGFEDPFKACCGDEKRPLNFNFKNLCGMLGTRACKDPDTYIHWDGIHLTEAMHRQISHLFLHNKYCKPSFPELIQMKRGVH